MPVRAKESHLSLTTESTSQHTTTIPVTTTANSLTLAPTQLSVIQVEDIDRRIVQREILRQQTREELLAEMRPTPDKDIRKKRKKHHRKDANHKHHRFSSRRSYSSSSQDSSSGSYSPKQRKRSKQRYKNRRKRQWHDESESSLNEKSRKI